MPSTPLPYRTTSATRSPPDTALAFKVPEIARGARHFKLGFRDDYDNTADGGRKPNDTRFTLGLTLDF